MHRHYIFTDKRESKKGILSAMLGAMSLISVFLTVYFTWQNHGTAYVRYGVVTLLCGADDIDRAIRNFFQLRIGMLR